MRILITNDDGIDSEGLFELAHALYGAGYEIFIAAPSDNQSCISHSLTLRRPLYAGKHHIAGLEDIPAYYVTGTPSDCVRLAVGNLGAAPDVIVSGINHAPNLGTDTLYSGTVSAAIEGCMIGIPSIAVSKDTFDADFMGDAARFFARMLPKLISFFNGRPGVLNVNVPSCPEEEYKGIKVAKIGLQEYALPFDEETEDSGRIAYRVSSVKLTECFDHDETDELYMRKGYAVITPLTYDLTDYSSIGRAKTLFETEESEAKS
ncbi:MAG: 5'/3'-nucleotidase SurE [Clostridia bacterium]|nr:5'/3'-nucleotidase SurE [Clostridia bacterium]